MLEKIKDKLDEVIAIAESCPEQYRVKCFGVLLTALTRTEQSEAASPARIASQVASAGGASFLTQQNIGQQELEKVIHYDGQAYGIIITNLKVKSTARKQIRLGLLLGAKTLIETGKAGVDKTELIGLCKQYAAYDSGNFATHMKNNRNLFMPAGQDWTLTKPGQQQAAEVIKELAQ